MRDSLWASERVTREHVDLVVVLIAPCIGDLPWKLTTQAVECEVDRAER